MTSTDFTLPKLRTVSTSKTTGVVELRYAPRDVAMHTIDPSGIMEGMPPFMKRRTRPEDHGYPSFREMKVLMFDNIKVGDFVQTKSWLPVTGVDGDSITIDDSFTTGRESITGHKPKERSPDEVWAELTEEQRRALIHGVTA